MADPFLSIALTLLLHSAVSPNMDVLAATAIESIARVVPAASEWGGPHTLHEREAIVLVTAMEESGFRMDATGDSGHSHCMLQIWTRNQRERDEVATVDGCVRIGVQRFEESAKIARAHGHSEWELAQYAGGYERAGARALAERRLRRALQLARDTEEKMRKDAWVTGEELAARHVPGETESMTGENQ
jgi:hypothetical protein